MILSNNMTVQNNPYAKLESWLRQKTSDSPGLDFHIFANELNDRISPLTSRFKQGERSQLIKEITAANYANADNKRLLEKVGPVAADPLQRARDGIMGDIKDNLTHLIHGSKANAEVATKFFSNLVEMLKPFLTIAKLWSREASS